MKTKAEAIANPEAGDRWESTEERNTILKVGASKVKCRTHFPLRPGSKIWVINDAVTTIFKRHRFADWAQNATYLGGKEEK